MARLCPRCDMQLQTGKAGDIELDKCSKCGGIWFDNQELERIQSLASDAARSMDNCTAMVGTHRGDAICPVCRVPMKSFEYRYKSGLIVDQCDRCNGIWLDQGELCKIIDFSQADKETLGEELMNILPEIQKFLRNS